jgi:hypothetical protein
VLGCRLQIQLKCKRCLNWQEKISLGRLLILEITCWKRKVGDSYEGNAVVLASISDSEDEMDELK